MTFVNRVDIEDNFRIKLDSLYHSSYDMTNILVKNCGKHRHTDGGITLRLIDIVPAR